MQIGHGEILESYAKIYAQRYTVVVDSVELKVSLSTCEPFATRAWKNPEMQVRLRLCLNGRVSGMRLRACCVCDGSDNSECEAKVEHLRIMLLLCLVYDTILQASEYITSEREELASTRRSSIRTLLFSNV